MLTGGTLTRTHHEGRCKYTSFVWLERVGSRGGDMSTLLGPEGTGVLTQVSFRRTPAGRKVWHERCVATTRVTLNQMNRF